jgi:Lar family restriction alleviation protein
MSDLKKCPFCGGEAIANDRNDFQEIKIECSQCNCVLTTFLTKEYGIKAWNTRHNENQWISVKDRLPDKYGRYLVFSDGNIRTSIFYPVEPQRSFYLNHVTHWMPLPDAEEV